MHAHHPPSRWSSTTEAFLTMATMLPEVQTQPLSIIVPQGGPTFILLESDLKALRICHPLYIDTALIYHHPRGRPLKPGLSWLTKKWHDREIQTRASALTRFGSKSKTAAYSASSRPTKKASLSVWRGRTGGVGRELSGLPLWTMAIQG